jgi:predicted RNase H-like HicB family nuclease
MRQVILYQDEDGAWCAEVPSLPGCVSGGFSKEEAMRNIKEAIALWIEDAELNNELIPADHPIELAQV